MVRLLGVIVATSMTDAGAPWRFLGVVEKIPPDSRAPRAAGREAV